MRSIRRLCRTFFQIIETKVPFEIKIPNDTLTSNQILGTKIYFSVQNINPIETDHQNHWQIFFYKSDP